MLGRICCEFKVPVNVPPDVGNPPDIPVSCDPSPLKLFAVTIPVTFIPPACTVAIPTPLI